MPQPTIAQLCDEFVSGDYENIDAAMVADGFVTPDEMKQIIATEYLENSAGLTRLREHYGLMTKADLFSKVGECSAKEAKLKSAIYIVGKIKEELGRVPSIKDLERILYT